MGAPGDRLDLQRKEWFGFPRPQSAGRLEYVFDIKPRLGEGGRWISNNEDSVDVAATLVPWLFASGATQLEHFELPLLGPDDSKGTKYSVKLYFADCNTDTAQQAKIRFQGQAMEGSLIQLSDDQHSTRVFVREFKSISVDDKLTFDAQYDSTMPPLKMTAIEIVRESEAQPNQGK